MPSVIEKLTSELMNFRVFEDEKSYLALANQFKEEL